VTNETTFPLTVNGVVPVISSHESTPRSSTFSDNYDNSVIQSAQHQIHFGNKKINKFGNKLKMENCHVVNIWNSLPSHTAQAPSVSTFKGRLSVFDFSRFNCLGRPDGLILMCIIFLRILEFNCRPYFFVSCVFLYLGTCKCRLCLPWCPLTFLLGFAVPECHILSH